MSAHMSLQRKEVERKKAGNFRMVRGTRNDDGTAKKRSRFYMMIADPVRSGGT